jgi:Ca2+-binding EF-hand superfamily protein
MTGDRPNDLKKSDTLQIRIPHGTKTEFLDACRKDRVSASEILRRAILDYLSLRKRPSSPERKGLPIMIPTTLRKKRYLVVAGGLAGLAALVALPSAADPDYSATFHKIDKNGDGVLTAEEFFGAELPAETLTETRRSMRQDRPAPDPTAMRVLHEDYVSIFPRAEGHPDGEWGLMMSVSADVENAPDGLDLDAFDFRGAADLDPVATAFINMDADANDAINYAEFEVRFNALLAKGFNRLDRNDDGYLVEMEFIRSAGWLTDTAADGTEAPIPEERLRAGFRKLDANADGKLSLQEYLSARER